MHSFLCIVLYKVGHFEWKKACYGSNRGLSFFLRETPDFNLSFFPKRDIQCWRVDQQMTKKAYFLQPPFLLKCLFVCFSYMKICQFLRRKKAIFYMEFIQSLPFFSAPPPPFPLLILILVLFALNSDESSTNWPFYIPLEDSIFHFLFWFLIFNLVFLFFHFLFFFIVFWLDRIDSDSHS